MYNDDNAFLRVIFGVPTGPPMEILGRFFDEEVAINVGTEQEWIDFMEILVAENNFGYESGLWPHEEEDPYEWSDGQGDRPPSSLLKYNRWSVCQEKTYIRMRNRTLVFGGKGPQSSTVDLGANYYGREEIEIIKYIDLIEGE